MHWLVVWQAGMRHYLQSRISMEALKSLSLLPLATMLLLCLACGMESLPPSPTVAPDLGATVEAAVAKALPTATPTPTPDIEATVEARMAERVAAMPTPIPTETTVPMVTPSPTPTTRPTFTPVPTASPTPTKSPSELLSEMVKRVRPAVVRIETGLGNGTGVIFDTEGQTGYVMTNHHVIQDLAQVDVIVNDMASYRGAVLGIDEVRDLAVVQICCGIFEELAFGDAEGLEPGDEVVVMGYALGLSGTATVTEGIVSAVRYHSGYQSDVIQTDAAINPGNSGGPLISTAGKILGINTFRIDESRSGRAAEGLGFAISGSTVQRRIPALRAAIARPTPTPTLHPTPTFSVRAGYDFGPSSGELQHDPTTGFIKTESANVLLADMVVEATFVNPYSASSASWDYGFFIRDGGDLLSSSFVQVVVTSGRLWVAEKGDGSGSSRVELGSGPLRNLATGAGSRNHLRVVAVGGHGFLFVNNYFVSLIDLASVTESGDVAIITGAFTGDEVEGAVTRYENFKVDGLTKRYGPAAGTLDNEPGSPGYHSIGIRTRDLVAEAEFLNPRGTEWSYGFGIRNPPVFDRLDVSLDVIVLAGHGEWFHYTKNSKDAEYTLLNSGHFTGGLNNRNHLMVIAIKGEGWFFVNGQLATWLDLSLNQDAGDVAAMDDFFLNQNASPKFENFSVWAP